MENLYLISINLDDILRSLLPHFTDQLTEALPVHTICLANGEITFKNTCYFLKTKRVERARKSFRQRKCKGPDKCDSRGRRVNMVTVRRGQEGRRTDSPLPPRF